MGNVDGGETIRDGIEPLLGSAEAFEDFEKVVELDPESTFAQLAKVMMSTVGRPS